MRFELQVVPAPEKLAEAFSGSAVELRELDYGAIRDAMIEAGDAARATEAIFARSLHVDGQPLGLEGLRSMPGRYAGAIASAMSLVAELHGMAQKAAEDNAPKP